MDEDTLASIAEQLRHRVRDVDDPDENARWLLEQAPDPADWFRLNFALAIACPTSDWLRLTQWTRPKPDPKLIDEIAVERACRGDRVTLTLAERRAAVKLMTKRGLSRRVIAERLGLDERVVARDRSSRGAA